MVIDKNKIGYGMAKTGVLGAIFTLACFSIFNGYVTWGIIIICVDLVVAGLMVTDCWENM
jgi:hypothetical protein